MSRFLGDLQSTQQAQFQGAITGAYAPLKPSEHYGRVRHSMFTFNTGAGGITIAGYTASKPRIALVQLPKGARIVSVQFLFGAMGANAKLHLGLFGADGSGYITKDNSTTADSEAFLLSAVDVSAAGVQTYGVGVASSLNPLYELDKECMVVATAYNADWAANKDLKGHIHYVVD